MNARMLTTVIATLIAANATAQEMLLIADGGNNRVILADSFDGRIIDEDFLEIPFGGHYVTLHCARRVGEEIWVTDQVGDRIYRFDLYGEYSGQITGDLDNLRGMCVLDDRVLVANGWAGNSAPGPALIEFDLNGNRIAHFPVDDPFDVLPFEGALLVADYEGDDLELYTPDGTFIKTFHHSDGETGIDGPTQISLTSRNTVLAVGPHSPQGIFEYDATGAQINYWGVTSPHGVHELGNGHILFSSWSSIERYAGIHSLDPATGVTTPILPGPWTLHIHRVVGAVVPFELEVSDQCPGTLRVNVQGATPLGDVALLWSRSEGSFEIPPTLPCAGITLDLDGRGLRVAAVVEADDLGKISFLEAVGEAACGGFSQALDLSECRTSNVVDI